MAAVAWRDDNPWRRLPWTLPLALVLAALWLSLFASLLSMGRAPEQKPQPAIEAQLVTLPPPPAPPAPPETKPPPPMPPPPPPVPEIAPQPKPPPVAKRPPPPRPRPEPRPAPTPPKEETPPPVAAPAPPPPTRAPTGGQMGARAIYKPMPAIPDDLRRQSFDDVAVARFEVAPDGSAKVELMQPTHNPGLNRLLLDTLKTWRFFPAMANGQPVASAIEIRIPITVQ
jgi:protein TonB